MNAPGPAAGQPHRKGTLTPRDAATLIVVDRSSDAQAEKEPRILMGYRSGKHVFMPNTFVFPGGRLDPEDIGIPAHGDLREPVMQRLQRKASARKARALGLKTQPWVKTSRACLCRHPGDIRGNRPDHWRAAPWKLSGKQDNGRLGAILCNRHGPAPGLP